MSTQYVNTPFGLVEIVATEEGLQRLQFASEAVEEKPNKHTRNIANQLEEFFDGKRQVFDFQADIEGTDFQKRVWEQIAYIPFGQTWTYGEIAASLGTPPASRAVGAACSKNPLWLIVPCHRVVGASGKLTGYAGGVDRKKQLLAFEQENLQ